MRTSLRNACIIPARRGLPVPMRAVAGSAANPPGIALTNTSSGFPRRRMAPRTSPGGSSTGKSLRLCTAAWARPWSTAFSNSLVKTPEPPKVVRFSSGWRSPVVRTISSRKESCGQARRIPSPTMRDCTRANSLPRVARMNSVISVKRRPQASSVPRRVGRILQPVRR